MARVNVLVTKDTPHASGTIQYTVVGFSTLENRDKRAVAARRRISLLWPDWTELGVRSWRVRVPREISFEVPDPFDG